MKTLLTLSSEQGIDIPWKRIVSADSDIQYASHKSFDYIIDIENVRSAFCTLYIGIDFRKKFIFRFFCSKNVENTLYKKIQYSCFFVFFSKKFMKFPYLRFVKKFYFSKICEKLMFKIPICRILNFCFQKI